MHVKAKSIAMSGIMLALTMLFMLLGNVLEMNTLFFLAAASYFNGIIFREFGGRMSAAFYLAGLYRYEPDERFPRFVILTREAATPISFIHPRMPVIFDGRSARAWLDPKEAPRKILGEAMEDMAFEAV